MDENQVVAATVEVVWGGQRKSLPVLPMKPADAWRKQFVAAFPETAENVDAAVASHDAAQKLLKLMLAYDRSKVLGTKEWVEENVTDDELTDAFVQVYQRSFTYSRLPRRLVEASVGMPQPARSPNGRSPSGALTPINSAADSPTNS
ncbi:MAG: hypothetical protein LC798_11100 [Chloroflexi bacterium]|nr:hypothetical protein [Chloroflexota bacterium]